VAGPAFVIAATGLAAEGRIARRCNGVTAIAGGGDEARLAALLEKAISERTRGIISFGICGGLRPDLKPGTCIVGTAVLFDGSPHKADAAWTKQIAACLLQAELGLVAGSRTVVADPREKRALFDATGAIAADMESHVVARIAQKHGLPFAILRAVADPAHQRIPPAAVQGLKPDGRTDIQGVLKSLSSEPGQMTELMRVAANAWRARASLLGCHRLLGPGLGFVDLV
jgi:hopanoid-associated phosphorylase